VIVVTGAGFIGGRLITALASSGHPVLAVENDLTPAKASNLRGTDPMNVVTSAEFERLADSGHAFARTVDAVIHTAAHTDTWDRDLGAVLSRNLSYSTWLLCWCLRERIPLIYLSTAAVYGARGHATPDALSQLSPYAVSKLLFDRTVHQLLPAAAVPLVGLRLVNVYGPGEAHKGNMVSVVYRFHQCLHDTGRIDIYSHPTLGEPGSQQRDLVHVDDVVAVTTWFLDHLRPGIYDVGTGSPTSFNDLARMVIDHEGFGEIHYTPLPPHLMAGYQTFTRADLTSLRAAGFEQTLRTAASGVPAYLRSLTGGAIRDNRDG
jgi:ADP-L-glycero-D-manno-heptose 6-epimerase